MAKNIVLLSDGTGNSSAKLFKTNVWRLHQALDLTDPQRQIAYYDDGIGTSSFKLFAILGGIFGIGLKRNIIDLYKFLCRNYQAGDRIYGFGFSRGAFTIRLLMGMVAGQGLVPYDGNETQLDRHARAAYRIFRTKFNSTGGLVKPLRYVRDLLLEAWRRIRSLPEYKQNQVRIDKIHFVGVWDTVDAYGGPIQEITRAIDLWLWPMSMPDRLISYKIQRACHALALDDERQSFWPVLWDEYQVTGPAELPRPDGASGRARSQPMHMDWSPPVQRPELAPIDRVRLSQVWFAGMHADVGGGYPQDGLAYVALDWMLDRATVYGLLVQPAERMRLDHLANGFDKLNDSRRGFAGYYRYKPRHLATLYAASPYQKYGWTALWEDLVYAVRFIVGGFGRGEGIEAADVLQREPPIIHESVFKRIKTRPDGYSPIGLPAWYRLTDKAGNIRDGGYEHETRALTRAHLQERAWNVVWGRRVVYFLTLAASLFLVTIPLFEYFNPGPGKGSVMAFFIPVIDATAAILPGFASLWIGAFEANPGYVLLGLIALGGFLAWGAMLAVSVRDAMRPIWQESLANTPIPRGTPSGNTLFRVRTSPIYRGIFYALRQWILPFIFFVLIVVLVFVVFSRVFFAAGAAVGLLCSGSTKPSAIAGAERSFDFDSKTFCAPSGYIVEKGK
jgi:uncharacterized protein (DUF2235 family)